MMSRKEFLEDLTAICECPQRHAPTGTFYETVSFLEGYGKGHCVEKYYHSVFTPFLKWVAKKFEIQEAHYDTIIDWQQFRALFSSEKEAFKQLPVLYKEYAESVALEEQQSVSWWLRLKMKLR